MSERKWYPTGNLAWREHECPPTGSVYALRFSNVFGRSPAYELVRELFELEIGDEDAALTGNYKWDPLPVLPANPPAPKEAGFFTHVFEVNPREEEIPEKT